ncbi:sensor histidine kinase [Pseudobacteriovorax antillogorgiicola]|uniref:histidine kinase n=1 Tax=Pseudobacteriovorax antillogorgiicola TaxID=1513793 RepID=A0A1Y6BDL2_9BACT|nr:ATP-binding protein [Pseudobacteriovorax antillogorgiicola]TCS56414.1 signal transduction histidine kinase [Pseudobacteriovorax antillogorgiicola]SMF05797.1 Signal transduction histidine kinase [Pseudobacteriovorax antillogorgiicola]
MTEEQTYHHDHIQWMMKQSGIGVWSLHCEKQMVTCSSQAADILELDHQELPLESWAEIFQGEDQIDWHERLQTDSLDIETRVKAVRSGRSKYVRIAIYRGASDGVFRGMVQDISMWKIMQKRYLRTEHDLKQYMLLINSFSVIFKLDDDGILLFANEEFCRHADRPRGEMLNRPFHELGASFEGGDEWRVIKETIETHQSWYGTIKCRTAKGENFWLQGSMINQSRGQQPNAEYLCICRDVTSVMIQKLEDMQMMKLVSLGEASAQIMHDVMNPLTQIQGCEYMVQMLKVPPEQVKLVKNIRNMIQVGVDRIKDIFSGMRSMLLEEVIFEARTIKGLVEDSQASLEHYLKKHQVPLNFESRSGDDISVDVNRSLVIQVFVNLIKNSVEAIQSQEDPWIRISWETIDNELFVRIVDSGQGIPIEVQQNMFDSLYTTKKDRGGTGIGMAICKRVLDLHGGRIFVNNDNTNTEIDIVLPLKKR